MGIDASVLVRLYWHDIGHELEFSSEPRTVIPIHSLTHFGLLETCVYVCGYFEGFYYDSEG